MRWGNTLGWWYPQGGKKKWVIPSMEKGSPVWNLSVQVSHIGQSSFQEPVSTAMSTLPQFDQCKLRVQVTDFLPGNPSQLPPSELTSARTTHLLEDFIWGARNALVSTSSKHLVHFCQTTHQRSYHTTCCSSLVLLTGRTGVVIKESSSHGHKTTTLATC